MSSVGILTPVEAQDLLRHCLEAGEVIPGKHFREELKKEKLEWEAAWHVLKTGIVYSPPEQELKTGEWKYRVEGSEPDGKWLIIVFCFRTVDRTFLITVFSVEHRSKPKRSGKKN